MVKGLEDRPLSGQVVGRKQDVLERVCTSMNGITVEKQKEKGGVR